MASVSSWRGVQVSSTVHLLVLSIACNSMKHDDWPRIEVKRLADIYKEIDPRMRVRLSLLELRARYWSGQLRFTFK